MAYQNERYGQSQNGSSGSGIDRQTQLDRHNSLASVNSISTTLTAGGRLLDNLDLDEELNWLKHENSLEGLRQLHRNSSVNRHIFNNIASQRVANSRKNNPVQYQTRQMNSNRIEEEEERPKIVEAETPVMVGHVAHQDFEKATLEMNYDDDEYTDLGDAQSHIDTAGSPYLMNNTSVTDLSIPKYEDKDELRVKKAMRLRKDGKPREASYELGIAAHNGNKTAMLLYGLSLRYGDGLRKDPKQSFLWVGRAAGYDLILNANSNYSVDPFNLSEELIPKVMPEPDAKAYFELGIAFLNGIGTEKDENKAIQFLEKSASLGNIESMTQAGLLWSKKGPHGRKKDMFRSAAWLRFADKRGADNVGNSWIYKDKYMNKK